MGEVITCVFDCVLVSTFHECTLIYVLAREWLEKVQPKQRKFGET